jgi:uncharacterized protein (DUF924 family)
VLGAITTHTELLDFWFGPLTDGLAAKTYRQRWFAPDPGFDTECSARFGPLLAPATHGELSDWLKTAAGRLAFILLCDQIPRNVYRGQADAYAWDNLALETAKQGVLKRIDLGLPLDYRGFFYMPFQHSENLLDQHASVGLFAKLRDDAPQSARNQMGDKLRFAHHHREIILRFGRFPHRNKVLKRSSTQAEQDFMNKEGNDGFGQTGNN